MAATNLIPSLRLRSLQCHRQKALQKSLLREIVKSDDAIMTSGGKLRKLRMDCERKDASLMVMEFTQPSPVTHAVNANGV